MFEFVIVVFLIFVSALGFFRLRAGKQDQITIKYRSRGGQIVEDRRLGKTG